MKNVKNTVIVFLLLNLAVCNLTTVFSQPQDKKSDDKRMEWFADAKLGIFIHWGIYAVNGIDESWSFFNEYISHEDYMKQLDGFTAKSYNPQQWAELIKQSGAKYAVLTAKHHDGVALWDTKQSELNIVDNTPAARDLVEPFCKALRNEKLKVGLYYSLIDWSHPDYPAKTRSTNRYKNDSIRWQKFTVFNHAQINELSKKFNPDLIWFDGDWEHTAEEWKAKEIRQMLLNNNPEVIINSRLKNHGDYATPEQGLPVTKPKDKYWELCMTINNSWGYQHNDNDYKTANQIIRIFVDCIAMGGNLLLDIAPMKDGTIPQKQKDVLKELGRWTKKHRKAIYGNVAGIPAYHYYGASALSKDRKILYLFVDNTPNKQIVIKGLNNKINRIWVVGDGTKLSHKVVGKAYWSNVPGIVYIDVPETVLDKQVTIIALLLDKEIDLYSEE